MNTLVILLSAVTCLCGVAPQRQNDFYWENDKFGMRAYGPGEYHKWSGLDIFNKGVEEPYVIRLLVTEAGRNGNWHDPASTGGKCFDNYTIGASRGLGGVAVWADGEWKTYPDWESYKVIHTGDDYLEFELVYPASCALGKMTYHITMKKGEYFFRNDVSFEKNEALHGDWVVGPGLDLEPKRDHHGDLVEEKGLLSLFEDPKGEKGCEGSQMTAVLVLDEDVEMKTDHLNCRVFGHKKAPFTYYAGCANSLRGEFTDPAAWHDYVRAYKAALSR